MKPSPAPSALSWFNIRVLRNGMEFYPRFPVEGFPSSIWGKWVERGNKSSE
jgi:hypothetical protein